MRIIIERKEKSINRLIAFALDQEYDPRINQSVDRDHFKSHTYREEGKSQ